MLRKEAYTDSDGTLVYPSVASRPQPEIQLGPVDRLLGPVSTALMIAAVAGFIGVARQAGGEVPVHFGVDGEATRTGGIWTEGTITFLLVGLVWAGLLVLARYPRVYNYPHMLTEHNVQAQYRNGVQMVLRNAAALPLILLDLVLVWGAVFPTVILTPLAVVVLLLVTAVGVVRAFRLTG
ncbi:hypothetical protein [Nesterenkonia aerolata]|uniref:DUF1648 domain-containing protein n=1 Tax=Nesterenkonia aerolata TaxID=3074079 RepID=A0ABU2DRE4_9MICC|nr:hypothetical protein [Nesterenkonia sp. LY-0111]MDR8019051.1 hypothetical protein [Nesterenkonia sp. LY-0111]